MAFPQAVRPSSAFFPLEYVIDLYILENMLQVDNSCDFKSSALALLIVYQRLLTLSRRIQ
jgi:hypothetical protein